MIGQEPIITLNPPTECSRPGLDRFRQMVLDAGEVQAAGFDGRIARAEILTFLRVGPAIVGVGALKRPGREYSRGVFKNAHAKKTSDEFGLELGWVVVESAHRGHSYSLRIVKALVAYASGRKIYATSVTTRIAMHKALTTCSFERDGADWQSKRRLDERLLLFVHNGHSG
ncbi:hypothetical protein [Bradyrhizobium liaoningense]